MKEKVRIIEIVFEYYIENYKKGEEEPFLFYYENYTLKRAYGENTNYYEVQKLAQQEIESGFEKSSKEKDEETGEEIEIEITYDLNKLVSYKILAEED